MGPGQRLLFFCLENSLFPQHVSQVQLLHFRIFPSFELERIS